MVLIDGQAGVATGGAGWTATARPVETDAPVYGLTVQGAGFAAYVDPAFRVETGRAPVAVVVEAAHTKRQPADGLLGDVDGDGRVDIVDALLVAAYAVDPARSASDLDGEGVEDQTRIAHLIALGDVNGDGVLNLTDAALIGRSSVEPFSSRSAGLGKRAAAASNGTPKMYWTDGSGTIQRANLDGTQIENLITTGRALADLALDVSRGKIYWTDSLTGKIQRANLNGTQIEDLVTDANGLEEPRGLALDVSRGKIYWTDWRTARIQRANLDGTQIENLIITGKWPYSLALDASRGKMYWTDFRTGKIRRVNLDGTQAQDLIITGSVEPAGLALDVGRGKMYWTDWRTARIQRANLDGTQIETLTTTGSVRPAGLALDVGRGKMYWTDSLTGKIQRANLNGTQIETLTTGTGSRAGSRRLGDIVLDTSGAGTVPIESSDEGDDGGDGGDDDSGSSDDYSNTRSGATSLAVDGSRSGRLETGGDVDFFQVQVSRSGTLTVYTTGSTDTYGTLQNSSGSSLATNDDGGSGRNFSIARSVSAGTYYIQVRGFSSSTTGSYTVHARFQSGGGGGGDALSTSISLSASPHTISEDAAVTEIVLTATLDKALDADATVTISVDPNSAATRDVDYSALFNPLLTIPAGSTSGSVSLLIDPTTDRENEGNETITLTGSTPGLTGGSVQITLSESAASESGGGGGGGGGGDALSTSISLSASPHTISEDAAVTEIVLTATLDGRALAVDATVTISVDPNSAATRDVDYSALFNPLLIIPAGSTSGSIALLIDPTADSDDEGNETITLTASTPGLTSGSAQITISDHTAEPDDPGAAPLAFAEGASVDDQQYTAGTAIDALELPEASVGTGDITYSVSELPAGLSFDAATRTISGTPEAATDEAVKITYTATAGSESVSLTFSIKVNPITVASTPPPPPASGACYVGQVVRPNESCTLGGGELRNIGEGCLVYTPLGSVRFCSSRINVNGLRATRSGNDFTIEVVP